MRRQGKSVAFLGVIAALAAQGCATATPSDDDKSGGSTRPALFHGHTLTEAGPAALRDALADAAIVVVGERHGDPMFHEVQRQVVLHARRHRPKVAVAVEWLPHTAGQVVDAWMRTPAKTVDELAQAVGWKAIWGHNLDAYRRLLETTRQNAVELRPVNAPPGISRLVARSGGKPVDGKWRHAVPPLTSGTEAHFNYFAGLMRAAGHGHHHGLDESSLRRLYRAQLVWDETMAYEVNRLRRSLGENTIIIVFAGIGHTDFGHGIPARLSTGPVVTIRASTCDQGRPRAEMKGIATLIWCVPEAPASTASR